MPVMRSVFYTPSNNEKMVAKAPEIACDILTLDLEDSVPPAEKQKGREMIHKYLKSDREKQLSPTLYVRVNNWETKMTNDDLEAIVYPGLDGVCLAKCGDAENVKRLDWKLDELKQRRGMQAGSVAIQLLIETAKGVMNAYPAACASPRVNSLIFGAVDFTKDMRVTLTSEGQEQLYARYHTAVAARAAGCIAIDCPFVNISDAVLIRLLLAGSGRDEALPFSEFEDVEMSEEDRLRMINISASMGRPFTELVMDMIDTIKRLGPSPLTMRNDDCGLRNEQKDPLTNPKSEIPNPKLEKSL